MLHLVNRHVEDALFVGVGESSPPPAARWKEVAPARSFSLCFLHPPSPQCTGWGGGEVCFQTPRKHRWASSLSSNYSEFFVESGSLRAASPGSPGTWYLLHLWKNAPRHSLLTAKSTFYRRECGYSIVVEVTCHFQTFSTEQDWTALAGELYKKPPDWLSWASDLGVAHPDLCWLGGPHY
jgi:hypothetical protein